jgi:hypothetical protein
MQDLFNEKIIHYGILTRDIVSIYFHPISKAYYFNREKSLVIQALLETCQIDMYMDTKYFPCQILYFYYSIKPTQVDMQ